MLIVIKLNSGAHIYVRLRALMFDTAARVSNQQRTKKKPFAICAHMCAIEFA